MTELILWRHGLTDYNCAGRVQGQVDIPLNETGRAQARAAAPGIAALNPSRIVSSPLGRACQTAQALAGLCGLPVETDPGLLERSFGQWEGLTGKAMSQGWPAEYAAWCAGEDPAGVGVEPRGQCARRVGQALTRIAREVETDQGPIVAVGHGASISLGVSVLLGLDPTDWFGLRGLDNCHIARLRSGERKPGWMLVAWNDPGSLAGGLAHPVAVPRAW